MTRRGFFRFSIPFRGSIHNLEIVNFDKLRPPGHLMIVGSNGRLPPFPETPLLAPEKGKRFRLPKDLAMAEGVMFVTQWLKDVIEAVDPEAADFAEIEVHYPKGERPSSPYHFFAVCREIDALDLDRSTLRIEDIRGHKIYDTVGRHDLHFDEQRVGSSHLFKQKYLPGLIADSVLRDACKAAGITNYELFDKLTNMKPSEPRTGIEYRFES